MKRLVAALVVLFLGLVPTWVNLPYPAHAQSESGYDLIDTVNALRASLGLAAYTIDPWLMSYAQEHADYIDSLNFGTHLHSDGVLPWEIGIQENVGGGTMGYVTAAVVVYQIWVDEGHYKVMAGYPSGEIGAGVAYSVDNEQTYYVIDVRPGTQADITPAPAATAVFVPLLTSTPQADGWIVHTVAEGQTLWSIAISYGTTVNAIRELNGLPADSTFVYVGQMLKITQAAASTPTSAGAATSEGSTHTTATSFSPNATPQPTPTVTRLPSPTPTSTPASWWERLPPERVNGAIALLIIGVIGLFIVIRFGFIGVRKSIKR